MSETGGYINSNLESASEPELLGLQREAAELTVMFDVVTGAGSSQAS